MVLILKILGGLAAVGLGIYLGVGSNRQTVDEIQGLLGRGRPRKAKRHFRWINYMGADKRASERRAQRRYFKTATSTKRESDEPEASGKPQE